MVTIYVVDNGGQWTHKEWRMLRDLEIDTKIVSNTIPLSYLLEESIDGLVLSGGAPRIGLDGALGNVSEYLENAEFPILGICAGHQYMARFFGGTVAPSKIPEFGKTEITVLKKDSSLFEGVAEKSIVWESHNDEVVVLPKEFDLLASSETCMIQAISHKQKPFFGLQFHPEVRHTQYGEIIFKNFITVCKK
ncbi:MAG: GMP synthase subunit A [Thermoplasmatota archaeon]